MLMRSPTWTILIVKIKSGKGIFGNPITIWIDDYGVRFNEDKKTIFGTTNKGVEEYTIPNPVTTIG